MSTIALDAPAQIEKNALAEQVREIASSELPRMAKAIDEGAYPGDLLRQLGELGAWRSHLPRAGAADLGGAIACTSLLAEQCGSTAFLAWCQNTLAWYIANSENESLRTRYLDAVATGRILGGTALSNPMKSFYGIEKLKLRGKKAPGGYVVRGNLPWVSNLGPDHLFGAICDNEDSPDDPIMFVADCASPDVILRPSAPFLSMDGTGTYSVQFRDALIPEEMILAESALPFVRKIRAGFVLLQTGMAIGLVRDCIRIMQDVQRPLGHVNKFLEQQPEQFEEQLAQIESESILLAKAPYDTSDDYWRRVLAARLAGGEASVAAAGATLLHCGARGYVTAHRAQRRLREAYFVAIVTPATKQLRKMLAELAL